MKRKNSILFIILALLALNTFAQQERKYIRKGNKAFENGNFDDSEIFYRKAIDKKDDSYSATFNIGDALYKQEKYDDAINQFSDLTNQELTKEDKAKIYHNLGNSLLNHKKIKESIEAYKHALRNNPSDRETKYNLAYAQKLLEQQQNQDQNQDQDKNQYKDQDKDQNKDQKNQNQDQEQNDDQQNQNQKEQDQKDQKQDKNQQQKQQQPEISQQDAERILQALANDEKKTQQKVKEEKAKAAKVKVVKDW
ncbi:MAG TPA: tetratricopeptide repeat protein [Bacteroidales bacterium]|nr:tetratricopeptide repeat protein [Bacteroidales bacterium]